MGHLFTSAISLLSLSPSLSRQGPELMRNGALWRRWRCVALGEMDFVAPGYKAGGGGDITIGTEKEKEPIWRTLIEKLVYEWPERCSVYL